ncbi:MAG: hypothetical protein WDO19_20340 [Bacteroidota bacterium]
MIHGCWNGKNAKAPKEYIISRITISGIKYLDTSIVLSISGLQVGDKITHPGGNNFSKAISNLWRQRTLFRRADLCDWH